MGPIVNPANGHEYYLLSESLWTEAEPEAVELGGHLATINDQAEHDWVWSTFSGDGSRMLWIGLNDRDVEGDFVWVSGEPVTYTNWAPGEPNHLSHQDFVQMDHTDDGMWHDTTRDGFLGPNHGVVEVDPLGAFTLLPVDPGRAGELNTWTTVRGTPNGRTVFFFCRHYGEAPVPFDQCAHVNLDFEMARILGIARADGEGTTNLSRLLGAPLEGAVLHFQALDVETCEISEVDTNTF